MDKLIEIINTILVNEGNDPVSELKDDMDIRNDIGLTSFDLAELTVRIESDFDIDIFEDGLVFTIGEIREKLNV